MPFHMFALPCFLFQFFVFLFFFSDRISQKSDTQSVPLRVSLKELRVAGEGEDEGVMAALQAQDFVVYRKQGPGERHLDDDKPRKKAEMVLKDLVEFQPLSTAHLMKWTPWPNDAGVFEPRFAHSAVAVGVQRQMLLTFGGVTKGNRLAPQTMQLFDSVSGKWHFCTATGTAPVRRSGHTMCLDSSGNRVIIIGGSANGERLGTVDVLHGVRFDDGPNTQLRWNDRHPGQWRVANGSPRLPSPAMHMNAEIDVQEWCGCDPKKFPEDPNYEHPHHTKAASFFSPHTSRYAFTKYSMDFKGRSHHSCVLYCQVFLVFGGLLANGKPTNDLWCLDLNNFGSEKKTGHDFQLFQPKGNVNPRFGQKVSVHLTGEAISFTWSLVSVVGDVPLPRAGHAAAMADDFMVVCGGFDSAPEEMFLYNPLRRNWSRREVANLPSLSGHTMIVLGRRLMIIGGRNEFDVLLNNVYLVDMETWQCTEVNAMGIPPAPRCFHTATLVNQEVFVSSGLGVSALQGDMFVLQHPFDTSGAVSLFGVDLLNAFDQEEFADVMFVFPEEGKQLHAHRIILSCRSQRMRQLFEELDARKRKDDDGMQVIEIKRSYNVFRALVKYLYCDRISLPLESAREMIDISMEYGLDQLTAIATSCTTNDVIIPPSRLNSDMEFALFNSLLSDVTITVEGFEIPCHKVVLMNRSVYFRAMLTAGLREQHQSRILLPENERVTLNAVLRFIYTDTLDLTDVQLAFDLFCQASLYRISNLQDRCEQVLLDVLDDDNVATLFEAADRYASPLLKERCESYIARHFHRLNEQHAFDNLPLDLLMSLKRTRSARGLYLGSLEQLTFAGGSAQDDFSYVDHEGVDCPHCKLPFVYRRADWANRQSPKEMLEALTKGQVSFKTKIVAALQLGHLSAAVVNGKEYFRTRPFGNKRDAEQHAALFALHTIQCNIH